MSRRSRRSTPSRWLAQCTGLSKINGKGPPSGVSPGRRQIPAITYSRAVGTTIGPGCLTAVFGMGTGGAIQVCSPESCLVAGRRLPPRNRGIATGSDKSHVSACGPGASRRGAVASTADEGRIHAAERSAVSTGQLRRLPAVHLRPIDLVVFQEPLSPKGPETSSGRGFHA